MQRIILFGSSVTTHCNVWSDVDLYVELSEDVRLSKRGLDFDCDLWTTYTADENLKEEIMRTGVVVYRIRRRAPGFSHGDIRRTFSCSQLMPRYSSASSHNTLSGLSRSTFVL